MKTIYLFLILALVVGCKKNNNGGNGSSNSPVVNGNDVENYFTYKGETFYSQIQGGKRPTVCMSGVFQWLCLYKNSNSLIVNLAITQNPTMGNAILVKVPENGVQKQYVHILEKQLTEKVANGFTTLEFSNLKFQNQQDTSTVLISGKVTCNGN